MFNQTCYRHSCVSLRQADKTKLAELQRDLESRDEKEREDINQVWAKFSNSGGAVRTLMLEGILAQCCSPLLSSVSSLVKDLIRIDFISALPCELAFKILCYLDSASLCQAAQVSRRWKVMADDDVVWHRMCEQHIDRKCTKCGWGLPLLEKKRLRDMKKAIEQRARGREALENLSISEKRKLGHEHDHENAHDSKKQKVQTCTVTYSDQEQLYNQNSTNGNNSANQTNNSINNTNLPGSSDIASTSGVVVGASTSAASATQPITEETNCNASSNMSLVPAIPKRKTRPWKEVYAERYRIERNWREGRYYVREFKQNFSVMSLQFDEQYLITGLFDGTINVWDVETGVLVRSLKGHIKAVSGLKFDGHKLISGSYDRTVRVWNYKTGECISTFRGHEDEVTCLDFEDKLIASGSADHNIRVWDFECKSCFTLRGHHDTITSVKIDAASNTLFSSSEDLSVRMWDLNTKKCLKVFGEDTPTGHVGRISQVLPITLDHLEGDGCEDDGNVVNTTTGSGDVEPFIKPDEEKQKNKVYPTHILTASLDNTIRLLDVKTGKCVRPLFGHVEGVWSIAADTFRVVSGSHDKSVKIWDVQTGKCWHTLTGHFGPVCCIGLSDTRIASGSDDGVVRMYCFDDQ